MTDPDTGKQLTLFNHVIRGLGHVEHLGHHPGWAFLFLMMLFSILPGLSRGDFIHVAASGLVMFCIIFPMLACGAVHRSRSVKP